MAVRISVISENCNNLFQADITENILTIIYKPDSFGYKKIFLRGDNGAELVDFSFEISVDKLYDDSIKAKYEIYEKEMREDGVCSINAWELFIDNDLEKIKIAVIDYDESIVRLSPRTSERIEIKGLADQYGITDIIFRGTSEDGSIAETILRLTVTPVDDLPIINEKIGDIEIFNDGVLYEIDISNTFSDPDQESLSITADSGNDDLIIVEVKDNKIILSPQPGHFGSVEITVVAKSGSESVIDIFTVTVCSFEHDSDGDGLSDYDRNKHL